MATDETIVVRRVARVPGEQISSVMARDHLATKEDIPEMVKAVVDQLKPMLGGTETPGKCLAW